MQGISENLGDAPNASPIEQATYLTPEQQKLATQTFETQVEPLRRGFEERLETGVEGLARRGVAFGGVGSQGLADIFEAQTQAEAQLAGQIATGLGARSLDQAFQAAEAAKQREFARGERLGSQEFAGEEALKQREFIQSESALNRASQIEQLNISADQKEALMRLNADLDMQAQEAQRDFTTQEREAIQEYNTASQQAGFDQQFDILKYQVQQEKLALADERLLQAIQSGQIYNLEGLSEEDKLEAINNRNEAVAELLGTEGIQFTPYEEVQLQRIASNSGLTTEDYVNVRKALAEAQKTFILEKDENGEYKNIDQFIANPEAAKEFQKEIAEISKPESDEKVLCSELYRQGYLDEKIYIADNKHAQKIDINIRDGYKYIASPFVKLMRKSKLFTLFLKPFITSWAYHMAYKEKVVKNDNLLGKIIAFIGMPLCGFVGNHLNKQVLQKQKNNVSLIRARS